MNIIRILGNRVPTMVRFVHGFKKPPPMYKRQVVPSDLDVENIKWSKNHITPLEFEKKGDKKGVDLYYPKYGASIYDDNIITQYKEQNSRED